MNISRRNTAPVTIDRNEINYTNKTKILGMTNMGFPLKLKLEKPWQ